MAARPHTNENYLLAKIKRGEQMSFREQLLLTAQLSVPAMMAQVSSIVMQYIDASMVGSLGADDSASIGLVSTTTWLFGGLCSAIAAGFAVQVAHLIGANRKGDARSVLRQSLVVALLLSVLLAIVGCSISFRLPYWLGANAEIAPHASQYFFILMLCLPFLEMEFLAAGMLRCSGNMKVPSILSILMCVLDVAFNFLLIFETRDVVILGQSVTIPGAGLGVLGAALGTTMAEVVVCLLMMYFLCFRSTELAIVREKGSFAIQRSVLQRAFKIGTPIGLQHGVMCMAQVLITAIVAPLGSVAIAANAFAITAESLCYMPGYGVADAATTLVGQSLGARRKDLTRRFAYITVGLGMMIMTVMGVLMYVFAPVMMGVMSPVADIVSQGVEVLRIEAFAEPLFAASIVCYGVMVGAGDTLKPCIMNLSSMWAVRLTMAAILAPQYGLRGVWIAMCAELCFRGVIFLWRLFSGVWMKNEVVKPV